MIMAKIIYKILIALIALTLFGCAPSYEFAPEEKRASIKLLHNHNVAMCHDGKVYNLTIDRESKSVKVPVGKRVSIGSYMTYSGYNVTYSCYPFLSFIPKENEKYITDANIVSNRCRIDLVKEDTNSNTGLALENSLGEKACY